MGKSSAKFKDKFNRSYENLRKFLKLVARGCYSRNLFAWYSISLRLRVDKILRERLNYEIAEEGAGFFVCKIFA